MALVRYGNFAVDWSKVYAVIILANDPSGSPILATVYADVPGSEIGRELGVTRGADAADAVRRAGEEERFKKAGGSLLVDTSKVAAVILNDDKLEAAISFDLGGGRGAAIKIDPPLAEGLLNGIGSNFA